MEKLQFVAAGRNVIDAELAARIGNRVIGSGQRDYHRTHLRMNIAEDE